MDSLDQIPFNEVYRAGEPRDSVDEIRRALEFSNLQAEDSLYDEAVYLAREGHLGKARDRLKILLTLNGADGGAHLLMAKVLAAQRRWTEAIAELDAAAACGQKLPLGLKDALEEAREGETNTQSPRAVRTDGELKALREEARRMRTENSKLERRTQDLEHRAQVWSIATGVVTAVSALALVLIAFSWPGEGSEFGVEKLADADQVTSGSAAVEEELRSGKIEEVPATTSTPISLESIREARAKTEPKAAEKIEKVEKVEPPVERASKTSPTSYTVRSGDTLWKIAGRLYGDKNRWKEIRDANQDVLKGSEELVIGMVLTIPPDQT